MASETHQHKTVKAYLSNEYLQDLELIAKRTGIEGHSACIRFAIRNLANRIREKQYLIEKIQG